MGTRIKDDMPVTVLVESQFSHSGYLDRVSFCNRKFAQGYIDFNWDGETNFWMEQRDGDTIHVERIAR